MINIQEEITKLKEKGYNEENSKSRLCQDIVLSAIANSRFKHNITIIGGIVMRSLSKDIRRTTQDIDFDFIMYSISEESIRNLICSLKLDDGISIEILDPIVELKHQDYRGKRVFIIVKDMNGYSLEGKIDIGVHKDLNIQQENYCIDICFRDDGANLLINSCEQMITEKIKSLLRFGLRSTRYKDIFDIYYLLSKADKHKLKYCLQSCIYTDPSINVNSGEDILKRIRFIFSNREYLRLVESSKKNWTDTPVLDVFDKIVEYIVSLQ